MIYLVVGLGLFFGLHIYSAFRSRTPDKDIKARLGDGPFKGLYSLGSLLGFGLIIYGYLNSPPGQVLYTMPAWTGAIVLVANVLAFVVLIAAYVPGNHIKAVVRHPMLIAIILWSGSHLLMPTDMKELLLFGAFLIFGLVDAASAYRRPLESSVKRSGLSTLLVVVIGLGAAAGMIHGGHAALIGVSPY